MRAAANRSQEKLESFLALAEDSLAALRSPPNQQVINHEEHNGAYNCNDQTIDIHASDSWHSKGIKKPTADDGTHNSEQNVEDHSFTGAIDNFARDKASDQSEHDPAYDRHK
jgi:hypothetical protein